MDTKDNGLAKDKPTRQPREWVVHTSQESDALFRGAADGKHGKNYTIDVNASAVIHAIPGLPHHLRLELTPEEVELGGTPEWLMQLVNEQDADTAFALLYIINCLTPASPAPGQFFGNMVELDDVIAKIGWEPQSTADRQEMRRRIYQFVRFGERAHVRGARTGRRIIDKMTGEQINTVIDSPLWRIYNKERPEQHELFPATEVPLAVQIVISPDWSHLLQSSATAQFLPFAELLGGIPGGKPSGAWARVIGLALMNFWRRYPKEVLAGAIWPTRAELLTHYTPRTQPVEGLLESERPHRVLDYWCAALQILVERGLVEAAGEANLKPADFKKELPRYGWGPVWLEGRAHLHPGTAMREALEGRERPLKRPNPEGEGGPANASERQFLVNIRNFQVTFRHPKIIRIFDQKLALAAENWRSATSNRGSVTKNWRSPPKTGARHAQRRGH